MNTLKRIFSSVLAFSALSASLNVVSFAESSLSDFSIDKEFVEYSIPRHIKAQGISTGDTLKYSNPIPCYSAEDNILIGSEIFVIDGNEVIGRLTFSGEGENATSIFYATVNQEMTDAYLSGSDVAIVYSETELWFYSAEDGFSYIEGIQSSDAPTEVPSSTEPITIWGETSAYYVASRSIMTYDLSVKHVANAKYKGKWNCWAACVAMVVNYGKGKSLTVNSLLSALASEGIDYSKNGTEKALSYYDYVYVCENSAMSSSDVAYALKDNKPVIAHLKNSSGDEHAIVIRGLILDTNSSTYIIDDPNQSHKITEVVSSNLYTVNTSFSYTTKYTKKDGTTGSTKFSTWYDSFH